MPKMPYNQVVLQNEKLRKRIEPLEKEVQELRERVKVLSAREDKPVDQSEAENLLRQVMAIGRHLVEGCCGKKAARKICPGEMQCTAVSLVIYPIEKFLGESITWQGDKFSGPQNTPHAQRVQDIRSMADIPEAVVKDAIAAPGVGKKISWQPSFPETVPSAGTIDIKL